MKRSKRFLPLIVEDPQLSLALMTAAVEGLCDCPRTSLGVACRQQVKTFERELRNFVDAFHLLFEQL